MQLSQQADIALKELAAHWLPDASIRLVEQAGGGKNNTTRIIDADGRRYVLRVYETHRDEAKLRFEHAVLLALAERRRGQAGHREQAVGAQLRGEPAAAGAQAQPPLHTPEPQRTPGGETVVRIGDTGTDAGKLAALFGYSQGVNPALDSDRQLESLGRTAGLLGHMLLNVQPKLPRELAPAYRPYYEIEHTHPLCPPERVEAFCDAPPAPFGELADELRVVAEAYRRLRERLPALRLLPHQLVHGDLNASNVLAEEPGGDITTVLDFEFVTMDLRAMELAVCLSDVLQPEAEPAALWDRADALLRGYGGAGPRLTAEELDALPLLVELRRLDVFVHFLGRYWDEVDPAAALGDFVRGAAAHIRWLGAHAGRLQELCRRRLAYGGS